MASLEKINEIAVRYDVSTRTLRYYEEIGILASVQPESGQPRCYTPEAVRRLEQILALRRLQVPVREIRRIFALQDPTEALGAFIEQLRHVESEERNLRSRRQMLESLLLFFRRDRPAEGSALPDEIVALAEQTLEQRRQGGWHPVDAARDRELTDVRIIEIPPLRMARYHDPVAPSCYDSWRHMIAWACGYDLPYVRAFGRTAANPEGIVPRYGYEVMFALPDSFAPRGHVEAVEFPGGLYAVTTTWYRDLGPDWRALARWVRESTEYEPRSGLYLEELNSFNSPVDRDSLVDLLHPVQVRAR